MTHILSKSTLFIVQMQVFNHKSIYFSENTFLQNFFIQIFYHLFKSRLIEITFQNRQTKLQMNLQQRIRAIDSKILYDYYNILKKIPWCQAPEDEVDEMMRQTCVWDYINLDNFDQMVVKGDVYRLCLRYFKDVPCYYQIIKQVSYEWRIYALQIWNSNLTEQVFFLISKGSWKLSILNFTACNLNNNIGNFIKYLKTEKILQLEFDSDPIGNIGLKLLMKNPMPLLRVFKFANTNMTTDGLKLIKRLTSPTLTKVKIYGYSKINTNEIFKERLINGYCKKDSWKNKLIFRNPQQRLDWRFMIAFYPSADQIIQVTVKPNKQGFHNYFIYTGFISKLNIYTENYKSVYIFYHEPDLWYKTMLVPSRTQNEFKKIALQLRYS